MSSLLFSDRQFRPLRRVAPVVLATVILGGASSALADPVSISPFVLISNVSEPVHPGTIPFHGPLFLGASFETSEIGATSLYLVSALLASGGFDGTPISAQLRIDQDNRPGALVTDFGTVTARFGNVVATWPVDDRIPLSPLTKYWLVLGTTAFASWRITGSGSSVSSSGWTLGPWTQSNDAGASWLLPRSDVHPLFQLNGTPVPEPASVLLISLGLTAMGVGHWRGSSRRRCACAMEAHNHSPARRAHLSPDWEITGRLSLLLRAERESPTVEAITDQSARSRERKPQDAPRSIAAHR